MATRFDTRLAKLELVRGNGWREWRDVSMERWPTKALEGLLAERLNLKDASAVREMPAEELRRMAERGPSELLL